MPTRPECLGHLLQGRFYLPVRRESDAPLIIPADKSYSLDLNLMGLVGREPDRPPCCLVTGSDDLQVGAPSSRDCTSRLAAPNRKCFITWLAI